MRSCVSEGTVRGWVRDRLLPHLRVGAKGKRGKILIEAADLESLLDTFKVGRPDPGQRPAPPPRSAFKHLRLN